MKYKPVTDERLAQIVSYQEESIAIESALTQRSNVRLNHAAESISIVKELMELRRLSRRKEVSDERRYGTYRFTCTLPPFGWYCTRDPGHEGPCAAVRCGQ